MDHFLDVLTSEQNNTEAAHLLDYRQYFDYDLLVWDSRDAESKPVSVDKQSGKMSGGENQSPYFVAILASYLRAYKRHERRWNDPSLALVPIDEAFSKMDTGRIKDCIEAIQAGCLDGEDRATAIRQLNELNGSILFLEGPRRDSDIIHQVRFQPANEAKLFALLGIPSPAGQRETLARQFSDASRAEVLERWRESWQRVCGELSESALHGSAIVPFSRDDFMIGDSYCFAQRRSGGPWVVYTPKACNRKSPDNPGRTTNHEDHSRLPSHRAKGPLLAACQLDANSERRLFGADGEREPHPFRSIRLGLFS